MRHSIKQIDQCLCSNSVLAATVCWQHQCIGMPLTAMCWQASQLEEEVERMKTALSKAVEIGRQLSAEETQLRADAEEVEHKLQRDTDAARCRAELFVIVSNDAVAGPKSSCWIESTQSWNPSCLRWRALTKDCSTCNAIFFLPLTHFTPLHSTSLAPLSRSNPNPNPNHSLCIMVDVVLKPMELKTSRFVPLMLIISLIRTHSLHSLTLLTEVAGTSLTLKKPTRLI